MIKNLIAAFIGLSFFVFSLQAEGPTDPAAFPKQELGTKPPVLKDFSPLSEAELQEGWIRPFDGVSHFGWRAIRGTVEVQDGRLINADDNGVLRFSSRFENIIFTGLRRQSDEQHNWTPFSLSMDTDNSSHAGTPDITLTAGEYKDLKLLPKKMTTIFNGKNLKGWTVKPKAKAQIVNGTIRLTGGSGSLESEGQYADFVLQLEYKTDKPVNSGVFFRCIPGEMMNGYECQIFNNPPEADYSKFIGTDSGGIFRRQVGRNVGAKDGEWNYLTIFVRDAQISTWINGIQVADWVDERNPDPNPRRGRRTEAGTIQFQGHDPETEILFRNIRIGEF